jgi:hypothetical protein
MAKAKEEITNVPALIVTPEKAPVVSGNFEQIETYLQKWRKQVSKVETRLPDMQGDEGDRPRWNGQRTDCQRSGMVQTSSGDYD